MIITDSKTFTFLSVLTGIVVVIFVCAATAALMLKMVSFVEYAGAIGPVVGLLVGMWVKT